MNEQLHDLIQDTIRSHYVAEYRDQVQDAEALGVMIAQYFEWDGIRILDAFQAALTDANFHGVSQAIDEIREREDLA
jgi:beta-glucosidase/6-phospho-beta-glucosidase/beta-galactosidase